MWQEAGPDLKPNVGDLKAGPAGPAPTPASRKPSPVRLNARLLALARRIPPGSTVADIGTDHGLLPAYLERNGLVQRVIGTDSSPGSLASAARTRGLCECCFDLRLGYGLDVLEPGEAGVLVIAGLGGQTMAEVLSAGMRVAAGADLVIIQPMKDVPQFRRWAERSGVETLAEDIVLEGRRLYNILTLGTLDHFSPAGWDAAEAGIEHEVTGQLLLNEPDAVLKYLRKRHRTRCAMAASRAVARPQEARDDREVARRLDQHIRQIEQHVRTTEGSC